MVSFFSALLAKCHPRSLLVSWQFGRFNEQQPQIVLNHIHIVIAQVVENSGDGALDLEDLSRVHDVIGVDRLLDCTHDAHRLAVLSDQKLQFTAADAVLACAGAVE